MDKDKLVAKVCQDTGDIFTRLFDHRPFLNGEVQNFVREFESKKGNKDIEGLLKSREKLTDLKDLLSTSIGENTKELINNLVETIKNTTTQVEEAASPKLIEKDLQVLEKEELRLKKKEEFLENITAKQLALEKLIKEKELEIRSHYQNLEEKLKTT